MYLEYDEYKATGTALSEEDFLVYEEVAEAIVDAYTFSVLKKNAKALSAYGDKVRKAMIYQLSFMEGYKSLDAFMSDDGKAVQSRSVTVGGTSESVTYKDGGSSINHVNGLKLAPIACAILAPLRASGRIIA